MYQFAAQLTVQFILIPFMYKYTLIIPYLSQSYWDDMLCGSSTLPPPASET